MNALAPETRREFLLFSSYVLVGIVSTTEVRSTKLRFPKKMKGAPTAFVEDV